MKLLSLEKQITIQNPKNQIAQAKNKILSFERSLLHAFKQQFAAKHSLVDRLAWQKKIDHSLFKQITEKRTKLSGLIHAHLKGIDPQKTYSKKDSAFSFKIKKTPLFTQHPISRRKIKVLLLMHDGKARLTVDESFL